MHTSSKRKAFVKKSHTRRNISILATLVVVVIIIVALSGALSQAPTYIMVVHVYDNHYEPFVHSLLDLNLTELIPYVNVTVAGVSELPTPTGIIDFASLKAGTYQITVSGNGTRTTPFAYYVGPNCADQYQGQCHALVPTDRNAVVLPSSLNRCTGSNLVYHAHFSLSITISGTSYPVPANAGIFSIPGSQYSCIRPIHTHDTSGTIHVETDLNQSYTLGDFFQVWGNWENNAQTAIFSSTQIFGNRVSSGHTLTMTVNGNPDSSFQNYQIPENAQTATDTCSNAPCQTIDIAITYN